MPFIANDQPIDPEIMACPHARERQRCSIITAFLQLKGAPPGDAAALIEARRMADEIEADQRRRNN